MGKMPTAKSAATVTLPLHRAKRGRAKRPAASATTIPITSQVSTCRASPMRENEEGRVHRDEDQLRCGRTRNWPTFERFLNASVCRPPTRLRRIASMSSSIFWRILAQFRLLTPPTRIL